MIRFSCALSWRSFTASAARALDAAARAARSSATAEATWARTVAAACSRARVRTRLTAAALRWTATAAVICSTLVSRAARRARAAVRRSRVPLCRSIKRVHGVQLAGQLTDVLGVQDHREPHQRGVAVGVVARGQLADLAALLDHLGLGRLELRPRHGQVVLSSLQPGLHPVVLARSRVDLALGHGELLLRRLQPGLRALQQASRRSELLAGLLQVALGVVDLTAHLVLTVAKSVRVRSGSQRRDSDHEQRSENGCCLGPVAAEGSSGEGTDHRDACSFGEVNESNVAEKAQTLRYLRVITSVGTKVSTTPSAEMPPRAESASCQSTHSTMFEPGRNLP